MDFKGQVKTLVNLLFLALSQYHFLLCCSFIAVENIDRYCVLISSKAVYFLKSGDCMDRDSIFLEVRYDDLYHCLVSKDHGNMYIQLTKKAVNTSSGVAMPGPSQQRPMVRSWLPLYPVLPLSPKG